MEQWASGPNPSDGRDGQAEKERHCPEFGKAFSNLSDLSEARVRPMLGHGESKDEPMGATIEAVTTLLGKYNAALNASNTEAVMPLYAEDGVFMPPYIQSAFGSEAVRKAYDDVFKVITLSVKFTIAEIVEVGPGRAFAPTNSAGTTDHATERKAQKATRSCSSSRRIMMAPGKSRGTVFHRRIRHGLRRTRERHYA